MTAMFACEKKRAEKCVLSVRRVLAVQVSVPCVVQWSSQQRRHPPCSALLGVKERGDGTRGRACAITRQ